MLKLLAHPFGSANWEQALRGQYIRNRQWWRVTYEDGPDPDSNAEVLLAVGPEGGWLDAEIEMFEQLRYDNVRIAAGRTLDTHTACVALCSLAAEMVEDQSWFI